MSDARLEPGRPRRRPRYPMSEEVAEALEREGLRAAYDARPPYQRNDYIGWIDRAVRPQTRMGRIERMLSELRADSCYMGMPWSPRRRRDEPLKGTAAGHDAL